MHKLKIFLGAGLIVLLTSLTGCSGAHTYMDAGLNMSFGPGGPRITPEMSVNVVGRPF
jgi:hypothetical protein